MSWTIRPWSRRALGSFLRRRRSAIAPAPPLLAPPARRTRLWRAPAAILVALVTLVSGLAVTGGAAVADTASTFPPPDLFNLSALQLPATNANGQYYPGGIYSATPAQVASLQALEQEAIANTISDHALAPSDADAVDSWARSDADAELWALLVQAIQAVQAGNADTDQQNAVAWLTSVVQRQGVLAAQDAGLEYTKWAGLGISAYQDLIATNPSESALSNFLSGTPLPYTDGGSATDASASADGGYCVYQSPAPYQGDYTANVYTDQAPQTCLTPCTNVAGCLPPTPTYDQFLEWGDADADDQVFNNAAFASDARGIAMSATMGGVASGGAIAAGLGTGFALGASGVLAGTAFQTTILPFAAVVNQTTVSQAVNAELAAGATPQEAAEAASEVVDAAEAIGGDVAATGVGVIVAAAIFAVVTAVQEGLSVFTAAQLPGQLAQDIAGAPTATYDLGSMLSSGQAGGLYSLFVGSTEPDPTFTSCDNASTITVSNSPLSATAPCLNPTPVPAEESYDPQWVVTPQGSTTSTTQPTITLSDAASQLTSDVYLHGNWFVSTATIDGAQASALSLRLQYTDWSGNEDTAWLFDNEATPEFVVVNDADLGSSFDPSTCLTGGGGCSVTQSIDYVDGNSDYSASVTPGGAEPPALPPDPTPSSALCSNDGNAPLCVTLNPTTTTLTASPSTPSIGQQVTLTAVVTDFYAGGTVDFTNGSSDLCSAVPVESVDTSVPGSGGSLGSLETTDEATCTTTFSQAGGQYVFATYSGDNNLPEADEPSQGELTLDVSNQAATSTSVSADTTPVVGQLANYTATVSDYPGGPTPGGTVTFTSGGNTLCSGVPVSPGGTAVCAWAFEAPGSDTVTASYSGDANTLASSGQTTVTVGQATTQTKLELGSASSFPGQVLTYQASVTGQTNGPAPTGTVTFTNGSTTVCANVALSTTDPFTATCAVTYSAAGDETLTATYSGDTNYLGSSSQNTVSVSPADTSTSVSASPAAPVVGQAVTFTATVTSSAPNDANPPSPAGTVTFTNAGNAVCSNVALSPNGTATCTQTYGGPGPETVTASYSGDDATMASSGQAGVSVAKASSSTSVVPSVPAPVVGQPVTYTATVAAAAPDTSGPVPTGTVTFTNGNNALCSGLVLTAAATTTCTQAYSAPGPETVTASYSGDNANLPSSGQAAVAVSQASTTTALTATATAVVGQPVTYTASVSVEAADTDGPAPTGTVSFGSGTTTVCANVPLSANGTATCAESYQSPGPEALTAKYSGDTANLGSSGQATVMVDPASTTTSLSASTSTPVVGQPVTYTASISVEAADTDGPAPTGTVSFGNGQGTVCANVAVSPAGTATCDLPYSSTGPETLTGTYSGDTANLGSSGQASVTVGQASTTTSLLASSASTTFGQSVTLTAQVSPTAPSTQGPTPSGTVSFTLDGEAVGSPVPLSLGLAVSPPLTNLAPGAHQLTATYSGDANYNGSQGSTTETVTCSQTITTSTRRPVDVTGSTCLEGGSVSGKVTIRSGGNLALVGGSVNGPITGSGAANVLVCGTTVHGSITLTGPTGPVQFGGASGSSCAPDRLYGPLTVFRAEAATSVAGTAVAGPVAVASSKGPVSLKGDRISGPVEVTSNTAGLTVSNDTITRSLTVTSNSGPVVVSSNSVGGEVVFEHNTSPSAGPVSANTVSANTVGGALECAGNAPAPVDAGTANQATRGAHGQCASLV